MVCSKWEQQRRINAEALARMKQEALDAVKIIHESAERKRKTEENKNGGKDMQSCTLAGH